MKRETIATLTTCSAGSAEYAKVLKEASVMEIRCSVQKMYGRQRNKTRIAACERELKLRGALK